MTPRNFVKIKQLKDGNTNFTFYEGNAKIVSVLSKDMDAKWLEYYRNNHVALRTDLIQPDELLSKDMDANWLEYYRNNHVALRTDLIQPDEPLLA